jgi:hypothetical protein
MWTDANLLVAQPVPYVVRTKWRKADRQNTANYFSPGFHLTRTS